MLNLQVLGVGVLCESDDACLLRQVREKFRAYEVPNGFCTESIVRASPQGEGVEVSLGGRRIVVRSLAEWPSLDDLVLLLVVAGRPDLRFVHAASVEYQGAAVIFVGASSSGKTTLSLAIQEFGGRILADDVCVLDVASGVVYPLRTAPMLRNYTQRLCLVRGWQEHYGRELQSSNENGVPPGAIFLLSHGSESTGEMRDVSTRLDDWKQLYQLCTGEAAPPIQSVMLETHGERSFDQDPHLTPCSKAEALRAMCALMHPPYPPLPQRIAELAPIIDHAKTFMLSPGRVDDTVRIVLEAITEARADASPRV